MSDVATPPDFTTRLGAILAGLASLVAAALLRHPFHAHLIPALWTLINRASRRAVRAFLTVAAARPARAHAPRAAIAPRKPSPFPTGRAWLVRILGSEAACRASQLAALLAEPEAAAALAASPAARRALAPIRHMLGLTPPRPYRPRAPRAKPEPPPPPERPIPPAWMLIPEPGRRTRPYWMPSRPRRPPPACGWAAIKAKRKK